MIAGDGSERANLQRLIDRLGINSRAHLLGWRDDVQDLFSAFTIYSMSSRSEGTSISLLEAMSSGLVPIVTDVGGNAAVLGPSLSGCLVPAGQPSALAQAWQAMATNPALRASTASAARQRVIEEFSLAQMAHAYEAIYDRRLSGSLS